MNYTAFNSSSSNYNVAYDTYNSTAGGWWASSWVPIGCYYVSIDLFDNDMVHFANYGFDYAMGMDCSNNTGGNNTGGNNTGGNNTGGNNTGNDVDMDGIDDLVDNCPNMFNSDQADLDNDGSGDLCDSDIDGDGAGNNDDTFPENPNEQVDTDGDGVGNNQDADDDGDGIMDITDNCPLTPNSDQEDVDSDGIGTACDNMETPDETTPGGNSTAEGNSTDDDSDSGGLPSIGVIGTLAAIGLSFVAVIRREQEE